MEIVPNIEYAICTFCNKRKLVWMHNAGSNKPYCKECWENLGEWG